MEEIKLDVQIRETIGTQAAKKARKNNYIPGIVYGGDKKPTSVQVDRGVFERIERQHQGESVVLHLNVMDKEKKLRDYTTIIKEIQYDPARDKILHVDFLRISLTEEIEVKVPVIARGEAIGVKKEGGSLDHHIWELTIICLPMKIPQHIEVNVSDLKVNDSIHVKDILLPEGVRTTNDPEDIIITVAPPMKEEEEPAEGEEAAEGQEPEVMKEKKDKEGKPEEKGEVASKPKAEAAEKKPQEKKQEGK